MNSDAKHQPLKDGKSIVEIVMLKVRKKRRSAKRLIFVIYNTLLKERVAVDRPCHSGFKNTKTDWFGMGIKDEDLRTRLAFALMVESYTTTKSDMKSKVLKYPSLHVHTHNY